MTCDYDLSGCSDISEEKLHTLSRARSIQLAIQKRSGFTLLQRLRCDSRNVFEAAVGSGVLMIDVCIDRIALQNPTGVRPREELAIVIPTDEGQLVSVFSLRKSFPRVLHTNATPPDSPISLCLYAEKPKTVLMTWTAERFLARIQQWLYLASEDRLHGRDQAPEQLFIHTGDELVIPPNLGVEQLQGQKWQIAVAPSRHKNGGHTYFLSPMPAGMETGSVEPILIDAGDFGHQAVEFVPRTLGDLMDIYQSRGVTLLTKVQKWILEVHQAKGLYSRADAQFTIILISATVHTDVRAQSQFYAYFVNVGPLTLGKSLGVLDQAVEGSGSVPVISFGEPPSPPDESWRQHQTHLMEILEFPSPEHFRLWSGIPDKGPQGVLIGTGALGSELLNHWVRSGWGDWTVVDDDYVRPHNLARHTAICSQIGFDKAAVVADIAATVSRVTSQVKGIVADACDAGNQNLQFALSQAALVVDASADIQYPRDSSRSELGARHVSVFATPDGWGAVMLFEDAARRVRLHSLEAQYYRAILTNPWGVNHLASSSKQIWTGRSCRDRSFVMPHTRIAGHAALLAEQIILRMKSDNSCIRVWSSDPETNNVQIHEIEPAPVVEFSRGSFTVVLDEGLLDELKSVRQSLLPNETGGVLLGYVDISRKMIILVKGMTAPPDSISTPHDFVRGKEGVTEMLQWVEQLTMGQVRYVGEWHSHPWGCSSNPSDTDIVQLSILSRGMAEEGLPVVSLIVGEGSPTILVGQQLQ